MNIRLPLLLTSLLAAAAPAAPLKIGIVDMNRIYLDYNKTRTNEGEIEKDKADAKKEVEKRMKKYEQLRGEYEEKKKVAANTQLPKNVRQKAEAELASKAAEIEALGREIQEFARRRQAAIADKLNRMRKDIIGDLHKFVADKSKSDNYDLVFDKSGRSPSGVEVLLFSKDAIDFTDDLLKDVNKATPPPPPDAPVPKIPAPEEEQPSSLTPESPAPKKGK